RSVQAQEGRRGGGLGPSADRRHHHPDRRALHRGREGHGSLQGARQEGAGEVRQGVRGAGEVTVEYLAIGQALALHDEQLKRYGGATGLRDRGAFGAALARPAATFGGEDLYPEIADKAAALMHSLALNHPFVDGNKRVAAFAALVFVESNGFEFLGTPDGLAET